MCNLSKRVFCVLCGFIIHTVIAIITFNHVKDDFSGSYQLSPDYFLDLILDILYLTVIDATLGVCQLSRSGVRIWHWKINTVIAVSLIIGYFSNAKFLHSVLLIIGMLYIYYRLGKAEKKVYKVGLSKYMKSSNDADYLDISIQRNAKYVLITIVEAVLIYSHKVFFLSPLLFVIIDAVWNRVAAQPRTKLSDLYVSVCTASMDTGLWMALFNVPCASHISIDLLALMFYVIMIELLVALNDDLVQQCYAILNNKTRWVLLMGWSFGSVFIGQMKHQFAIYVVNITTNMLFVYMASDLLQILVSFAAKKVICSLENRFIASLLCFIKMAYRMISQFCN